MRREEGEERRREGGREEGRGGRREEGRGGRKGGGGEGCSGLVSNANISTTVLTISQQRREDMMYIATVGMLQLHSKGRSCLSGRPISHPPEKLHQY